MAETSSVLRRVERLSHTRRVLGAGLVSRRGQATRADGGTPRARRLLPPKCTARRKLNTTPGETMRHNRIVPRWLALGATSSALALTLALAGPTLTAPHGNSVAYAQGTGSGSGSG